MFQLYLILLFKLIYTAFVPLNSYVEDVTELLNKFCTDKPEGIYCHPSQSELQVYCSSNKATIIPCPLKSSCRSHIKLQGIEQAIQKLPETIEEEGFYSDDDWLIKDDTSGIIDGELAQCVPYEQLDLDGFCEDALNEFYLSRPDHAWIGTKEEVELLRQKIEIGNSTNEILAAVQLCNPFHVTRKQSLKCYLVKKDCGIEIDTSKDEKCLKTKEIHQVLEDCTGYDMCRHYKEEDASKKHGARCRAPLDAMCLDRFWTIYADDFMKDLQEREISSFKAFTQNIDFKFCDPFRSQKQLECNIQWQISPLPALMHQSILPPYEKENMKIYIRTKFPELFKELYPAPLGFGGDDFIKKQFNLVPTKIHVIHHFCPEEAAYDKFDENSESNYYVSGPVCQQLSRYVSRCSPKATLKIGIDDGFHEYDDSNLKLNTTVSTSMMLPDNHAGFCVGLDPGQYCLPGSPELGILCPAGKIIRCRRRSQISDIDPSNIRCVQKHGQIPVVDVNKEDSFRTVKILNLKGEEVKYGAYATCEK